MNQRRETVPSCDRSTSEQLFLTHEHDGVMSQHGGLPCSHAREVMAMMRTGKRESADYVSPTVSR
ncbi:hypothetical protein JZ751_007250 [Albula glossodonta]|uniref:Uncharacterized protein n=1 Tax=Albula glossodonta TaxID=121402 RepID=A0A8T2N2P0_9TELE|nr:hypothetical protein JZ751_007250 [Albula glossodonta]